MKNIISDKIFVVDDDQFCLMVYEQTLKNLGYYDISLFQNGTDCLNEITEMPKIIFLDFGMDILNGIDVLKKIKRFNPDIYVVFISGQEDIQTAIDSLKYGAFDYIIKNQNVQSRIEQVVKKINKVTDLLKVNNSNILKKLLPFF